MISVSDKMKKVMDNGIRIYPLFDINHKFAVCVEDENNLVYKNQKTIGEFKHTTQTINEAVILTLNDLYNKIKNTKKH